MFQVLFQRGGCKGLQTKTTSDREMGPRKEAGKTETRKPESRPPAMTHRTVQHSGSDLQRTEHTAVDRDS